MVYCSFFIHCRLFTSLASLSELQHDKSLLQFIKQICLCRIFSWCIPKLAVLTEPTFFSEAGEIGEILIQIQSFPHTHRERNHVCIYTHWEKKLNYLTELIPSSLICLKKDLVPEKTYLKLRWISRNEIINGHILY